MKSSLSLNQSLSIIPDFPGESQKHLKTVSFVRDTVNLEPIKIKPRINPKLNPISSLYCVDENEVKKEPDFLETKEEEVVEEKVDNKKNKRNLEKTKNPSPNKFLRIPEQVNAQVLSIDTFMLDIDSNKTQASEKIRSKKVKSTTSTSNNIANNNSFINAFWNRLPLKTKPLNIFEASYINESSISYFDSSSNINSKATSSQKNLNNKIKTQNSRQNGSNLTIQKELSIIDLQLPIAKEVKLKDSGWKQKLIRKLKQLRVF
jgi:hypothetical protein